MKILVDADACPVKSIIVDIAKHHSLVVMMFFDTSHQYQDGYSQTFQLDKGRDNADYALIAKTEANDIVITHDYGLATMALAKRAVVLHPNGKEYTDDNILSLLTRRATNMKIRKSRRKGPKKRTKDDDDRFRQSLESLIIEI